MGRLRVMTGRGRRSATDHGSQFVEFAAYFPLFLFVLVLSMEGFVVFLASERMENAARAGARVAGDRGIDNATETARSALPSWLDQAEVRIARNDQGGYYAEVTAQFPILFEASELDLTLSRRVDMPNV